MLPKRKKYDGGGPTLTKVKGLGNANDIVNKYSTTGWDQYVTSQAEAGNQTAAGLLYTPENPGMSPIDPKVFKPVEAPTYTDKQPKGFLNSLSTVDPSRYIGDAAAILNFGANKRSIDKMPITQPYQMIQPALIDKTRQDAQAVSDAQRAGRMGVLAAKSAGVNATQLGNLSAIAGAQTGNQISQIRAQENARLSGIDATNTQMTNQANSANVGMYNQLMGDVQSNKFLQEQQRVNNRNMLTQSLLGNKFQRDNQDLEYAKLALEKAREGDRGHIERLFSDPEMMKMAQTNPTLFRTLQTSLIPPRTGIKS